MTDTTVLQELFGRIAPLVRRAVEGLGAEQLVARVGPDANTIGWLTWHLTRVQDHHMAGILDQPQVWVSSDWAARFGLDPDPENTGYGHSPDEVVAVRPDGPDAVTGYHDAVAARTTQFLASLDAGELDRVVDESFDPPVTMRVRLVSIASDDLQHAGQAAFVRGLL